MGTRWPETCWANYKGEINIILKVASSWSLYPHWTTMHGQSYITIWSIFMSLPSSPRVSCGCRHWLSTVGLSSSQIGHFRPVLQYWWGFLQCLFQVVFSESPESLRLPKLIFGLWSVDPNAPYAGNQFTCDLFHCNGNMSPVDHLMKLVHCCPQWKYGTVYVVLA